MSEENPWTTKSVTTTYENPWIKVEHHDVLNPAGNPGIYGTVSFKNRAVGVVPIADNGDTWLVGQYRFPLQEYHWEIPMGGGLLRESLQRIVHSVNCAKKAALLQSLLRQSGECT